MPEFYFSLPSFELLTKDQRAAIAETKPIALTGGAGTGKSVVSLWRHIINHQKETPTRSQLLTYTKTLAHYLKQCTKTKDSIAATYVSTSIYWQSHADLKVKIDEVIIDEAQDLSIPFNDKFKSLSNVISYGADNNQILAAEAFNADGTYNLDKCSPEGNLKEKFGNTLYHLSKNFRSTLSIMKFAKHFFQQAYIPNEVLEGLSNKIGERPRLLISNGDLQKQNDSILRIVNQFAVQEDTNVGILLPFENFGTMTHYTVDYYYDLITNSGKKHDCSKFTNRMEVLPEIKNIHITTFKSAKGLEFDVVIIPNLELAKKKFNVITWRDFYVGVTRAKSNLFLISNNDLGIDLNLVEKVPL